MMSKTHIAVGMASALVVSSMTDVNECVLAIAGGALGGVIADVDVLKTDKTGDAKMGEGIAIILTLISVVVDLISGGKMVHFITEQYVSAIIGIVGFIVLYIIGLNCEHREFTHSILAAILFSLCIGLIYPEYFVPFLFGYLSHLAIDIMNKKGILLFYPFKKKICFKWFYADRTANTVIMILGLIATAALLVNRFIMT